MSLDLEINTDELTFDLEPEPTTFADDVMAAARTCSAWHGTKVWIADVAAAMGTTVDALAPRLLAAHRDGALRLAVLNMADCWSPATVARSEISDRAAYYHFVRI